MAAPEINELPRVYQWLSTVLKADGTLNAAVSGRIFAGTAPQPTAARSVEYPLAIFRHLSSREPQPGSDGARIWILPLFLVEAIGAGATGYAGSILALQTIADRIDAVLHHARGGVTGVRIHWCRRETESSRQVIDNGVTRWALGGEYRVAASIEPNP